MGFIIGLGLGTIAGITIVTIWTVVSYIKAMPVWKKSKSDSTTFEMKEEPSSYPNLSVYNISSTPTRAGKRFLNRENILTATQIIGGTMTGYLIVKLIF